MPVTNEKTWQHNLDNTVTASGTPLDDNRTVLRSIKNALKGFSASPWTVIGSSDATTSGMDGVDRWVVDTDLTFNFGVRSWIVLQQSGIAAKCQLLIDLSPGGNANGNKLNAYLSPAAGFGTANGGTDGSTSARPTATDDYLISYTSEWTTALDVDRVWSVQQSTDGQCTRVFLYIPSSNKYTTRIQIEKAKTPIISWVRPVFATFIYSATVSPWSSSTIFGLDVLFGTSNAGSYFAGRNTAEGVEGGTLSVVLAGLNSYSGTYSASPVGILCTDTPDRGRHGQVFDMWAVSQATTDGTTAPANNTKTHRVVGDMLLPNNGTSPVVTASQNAVDFDLSFPGGPAVNTTPPTVTVISPTPGASPGTVGGFPADLAAARITPVVVQITDLDPGVAYSYLSVSFAGSQTEEVVYRRGQFRGLYLGSSYSSIANGRQYTLLRKGGWPGGSLVFSVDAIDGAGNIDSTSPGFEV
jgi:hypothetical protein